MVILFLVGMLVTFWQVNIRSSITCTAGILSKYQWTNQLVLQTQQANIYYPESSEFQMAPSSDSEQLIKPESLVLCLPFLSSMMVSFIKSRFLSPSFISRHCLLGDQVPNLMSEWPTPTSQSDKERQGRYPDALGWWIASFAARKYGDGRLRIFESLHSPRFLTDS